MHNLLTLPLKIPGKVYSLTQFNSIARHVEGVEYGFVMYNVHFVCNNYRELGVETYIGEICKRFCVHFPAIPAEGLKLYKHPMRNRL